MQALPSRLSEADGQQQLVDLPADKREGPLMRGNDRTTQQWWGRGYGNFRYFRYGSYDYPYYLNAGSYYPYSYPYYYGVGASYRPYYWRYSRRWW